MFKFVLYYFFPYYSFDLDEKSHLDFYQKTQQAYRNIFQRVGIGHVTYLTFASGGSFSKYSHEFQTLAGVGEDTIYIDESKGIAVNKEIFSDETLSKLDLKKEDLAEKRAVEVGNIFTLGTKYSEALGVLYLDENGKEHPIVMGSYGIGVERIFACYLEQNYDEKGLTWKEPLAPFDIHLIGLNMKNALVSETAERLYISLIAEGYEVLFDDRLDGSAGVKFNDADLLGMPIQVIVGEKNLKEGKAELKNRRTGEKTIVELEKLIDKLEEDDDVQAVYTNIA